VLHGEKAKQNEIDGKRLRHIGAGSRIDRLWYDEIADESYRVQKRSQKHEVTK
jgi:hypothetical protein